MLPFSLPPEDGSDPVTDALMGASGEVDPYTLELIRRASKAGTRQTGAAGAVERAMLQQAEAQAQARQSMDTRGISTPFGTVVMRKSPLEKLTALGGLGLGAYRGYKAGQEKTAADADVDNVRVDYANSALGQGGSVEEALANQEQAGLAGLAAPVLAPQASAYAANAGRQRERGDAERSRRDEIMLKRSLWGATGKTPAEMPDDATISVAESLGIKPEVARVQSLPALRALIAARAQRLASMEDRQKEQTTPEALAAAAEKKAREEEDRAREAEESRVRTAKGRIEIEKGRRDLNVNPSSPRFGEEWEPLPSSPLIDNEGKRMAFLEAAGEAKEARRLAGELKAMVDGGLGPTSSAADKTRAESIVTRLQLIGKKVDALGVLSETDITKFIEPQLVNPADFKVAIKKGFGQFDPKAQIDQYLSNLDGKIEASARTWAVKRKGGAQASAATAPAPAPAGQPPQRKTIGADTYEKRGGQWFKVTP